MKERSCSDEGRKEVVVMKERRKLDHYPWNDCQEKLVHGKDIVIQLEWEGEEPKGECCLIWIYDYKRGRETERERDTQREREEKPLFLNPNFLISWLKFAFLVDLILTVRKRKYEKRQLLFTTIGREGERGKRERERGESGL